MWFRITRGTLFNELELTLFSLTWWKINRRRVWRYQRGSQNPYIEEQRTQWPKEKSTKGQTTIYKTYIYIYKTKDRVTRTPLKTEGELRCSGTVSKSCSTSDTRPVNLVTNQVMSWMRKGPGSVYDRWNISVIICDTYIP
jgi:hypothetical protein